MAVFSRKPRLVPLHPPRHSQILVPDVNTMRKDAEGVIALADAAREDARDRSEEIDPGCRSLVEALVPKLRSTDLELAQELDRPEVSEGGFAALVYATALGMALGAAEKERGWQPEGPEVDARTHTAIALAGTQMRTSYLMGYFVQVGYWIFRTGEAGIGAL